MNFYLFFIFRVDGYRVRATDSRRSSEDRAGVWPLFLPCARNHRWVGALHHRGVSRTERRA